MALRIRISPRAKLDLDWIFHTVKAEQSDAALKWYRGLKQLIRTLDTNPGRCPSNSEDPGFRPLLYGRSPHIYRVIFRIADKPRRVEILPFRHGARKAFTPADLN